MTLGMSSINTAVAMTPILSGAIFLLIVTTPVGRRQGFLTLGLGGGLTGATGAAIWEYTYNRNVDPPSVKMEVIAGNAGLGAVAGIAGGMFSQPFLGTF